MTQQKKLVGSFFLIFASFALPTVAAHFGGGFWFLIAVAAVIAFWASSWLYGNLDEKEKSREVKP